MINVFEFQFQDGDFVEVSLIFLAFHFLVPKPVGLVAGFIYLQVFSKYTCYFVFKSHDRSEHSCRALLGFPFFVFFFKKKFSSLFKLGFKRFD